MNAKIDNWVNTRLDLYNTFDGFPWIELLAVSAVLAWMFWVTLNIKLPKQQ